MSSGKPEQEELWQRLQHPPAPREQAIWDGEVRISVQEERWVRMGVTCPESSWLCRDVVLSTRLMGGPRAGTFRGGTVWVRFLVAVRWVFGCNWSHLVLSIHQGLKNRIFPQAGGDLRADDQGLQRFLTPPLPPPQDPQSVAEEEMWCEVRLSDHLP